MTKYVAGYTGPMLPAGDNVMKPTLGSPGMGRGPMGRGPRGPMGRGPMGGPMGRGMGRVPLATPVMGSIPPGNIMTTLFPPAKPMKKGGSVKSSASKRADGIATKGKTRGKMV